MCGKVTDLICSRHSRVVGFQGRRGFRLDRARGLNAGRSTPKRCGQSTKRIEIARALLINIKINIAVPKALQDLAEATQTDFALTADLLQVDLDRDDLLQPVGLVKSGARGIEDTGTAKTTSTQSVDIEYIALKLRRRGARNSKLHIAIRRAGEDRMKQDFDPCCGQRPRRLRKPYVVADRQTKPAHLWDIKNAKLSPTFHTMLVRQEWKHFAIAGNSFATRIDDQRGVIDSAATRELENRTWNQPDLVFSCGSLESLLNRPGERRRTAEKRPERREFAEQDHLHPREAGDTDIHKSQHLADIVPIGGDMHLNTGNRERNHSNPCSFMFGNSIQSTQ